MLYSLFDDVTTCSAPTGRLSRDTDEVRGLKVEGCHSVDDDDVDSLGCTESTTTSQTNRRPLDHTHPDRQVILKTVEIVLLAASLKQSIYGA